MKNIDLNKIKEALVRGVENIYPNPEEMEKILVSGKKLKIYSGIDPTGKLHLGHIVILRKLKQFQDLGHEIIILFGGFTATIGDPAGKDLTRKPLSFQQVLENTKGYKKQIAKILDIKKTNVKFLNNEKWISKLTPKDFLDLVSNFTVARLLERDMFQKRIKAGRDIHVHEFLYPIFQAYDSVVMNVDMEVGGNDQTFNMLAGRTLMKKVKNKEKFVLTTKLLTDSAGKKMGKTEGNMIDLDENPKEIYGKIMSWPDEIINTAFEICTDIPVKNIEKMNPRDAKSKLAKELITVLYDKKKADFAEKEFNSVFKEKNLPSDIEEVEIKDSNLNILDLMVKTSIASSKAEARRLIVQGAVKIDKKTETDWKRSVDIKKGTIIQAGKRRFAKIK